MERTYTSWHSAALDRPMELLWFGWAGYPVIAFPTSMGRFFQYEDMGTIGRLAHKIDAGYLQIVCVDSVDAESWYDKAAQPAARARRHEQYDAYLRDEVVPFIGERARRPDAGTFGCSFGAYHAANFAARYPGTITKAVCLSGLYDVGRFVDGQWSDAAYFNSPQDYIAGMSDEWLQRLRAVDWVIATGEGDSLAENNRNFAALLSARGIPNHAEIWPGVFGHDWPFWNDAVVRLL